MIGVLFFCVKKSALGRWHENSDVFDTFHYTHVCEHSIGFVTSTHPMGTRIHGEVDPPVQKRILKKNAIATLQTTS